MSKFCRQLKFVSELAPAHVKPIARRNFNTGQFSFAQMVSEYFVAFGLLTQKLLKERIVEELIFPSVPRGMKRNTQHIELYVYEIVAVMWVAGSSQVQSTLLLLYQLIIVVIADSLQCKVLSLQLSNKCSTSLLII